MPPARSSSRGWVHRLGLAAAALLLLGIAGEVLLRVYPDASPIMEQIKAQGGLSKMIYAPDPDLGALLAPSRRDAVATLDFTYTLETDRSGFPNPEPWPRRVDVAVLGNSLLIGPGVGMNGQFTTLLDQRLGGRTVLNFGLPGGGTEHEYRVYRRYVAPLQPELVVAMLWLVWDIDNSLQFAHWQTEKSDADFTRYRYTYNDTHRSRAPPDLSPVDRIQSFLRSQLAKSYLLRAGYRGMRSLLETQEIDEEVTFPNGESILLSSREQMRLARGTHRPDIPDLEEIFFRPLEWLRTEVEQQGGRFVVVLVPSKEELYGAESFPAVLRPVQEVKSELESRRMPVLDLYPAFRELGRERPPFYRADMHLNQLGNQIVADAIADWIADERIFVPPSPPAPSVATVPTK